MFTCPACGQPDLHFHNIIQQGKLIENGLIQKIQKSYRYKVTKKGRPILTAVIAASNATVNMFIPNAA